MKHNKKRNTAFLFEALVRELTKTALEKDQERSTRVKSTVKKYFSSGTALARELELYEAISDSSELDLFTAEKLVHTVKVMHEKIPKEQIFEEQTKLINDINKGIGKHVYNHFVPNYRKLATIAQIFNDGVPLKKKILLERGILKSLVGKSSEKTKPVKQVDNIIFEKFVVNYNEEYGDLSNSQKELLNKYITSFVDEGAELKLFIESELNRAKRVLEESINDPDINEDRVMMENMNQLLASLEEFENKATSGSIVRILKLQKLIGEIKQDANHT